MSQCIIYSTDLRLFDKVAYVIIVSAENCVHHQVYQILLKHRYLGTPSCGWARVVSVRNYWRSD